VFKEQIFEKSEQKNTNNSKNRNNAHQNALIPLDIEDLHNFIRKKTKQNHKSSFFPQK